MGFGALIIGDEILVGKRQDKHFSVLVAALAKRGLRLAYCDYLAAYPPRLASVLGRTFASGVVDLIFGGYRSPPHVATLHLQALDLPVHVCCPPPGAS